MGQVLLINVKYTEILLRKWNQDRYCFLNLKIGFFLIASLSDILKYLIIF